LSSRDQLMRFGRPGPSRPRVRRTPRLPWPLALGRAVAAAPPAVWASRSGPILRGSRSGGTLTSRSEVMRTPNWSGAASAAAPTPRAAAWTPAGSWSGAWCR